MKISRFSGNRSENVPPELRDFNDFRTRTPRSSKVSWEGQCWEPRHFQGPTPLWFYIALSSIPRIVVSVEKCLKGISRRCDAKSATKWHSVTWTKKDQDQEEEEEEGGESKREKTCRRSEKRESGSRVEKNFHGNGGREGKTLRAYFLARWRGEEKGDRSFRFPCFRRFVTEYTSARREKKKKYTRKGGWVPRAR